MKELELSQPMLAAMEDEMLQAQAIENSKPETQNLKPETRNLTPGTRNPNISKPET